MLLLVVAVLLAACQGPTAVLKQADRVAIDLVEAQQRQLGIEEGFSLLPARQQLRRELLGEQALCVVQEVSPEGAGLTLTLMQALEVGAANSRSYQLQKEGVFQAALALDLERDAFRSSWQGVLSGLWSTDNGGRERVTGLTGQADGGLQKTLRSGASFALSVGLDLVQLLTGERVMSRGIVADSSIRIPLLRGAGAEVVTEPLQQAERDVLYALLNFERYKRTFAVEIASTYLQVLEDNNQVKTAWDNYQRLSVACQRARRLADAGRLPEVQVDQALQDELRARNSWVRARQNSLDSLDRFKLDLGLPTDAAIVLDDHELARLQQGLATAGVLKPPEDTAAATEDSSLLTTALRQRCDLRVARERIVDRQRAIRVAEDALQTELTLLGSGQAGGRRTLSQAGEEDARLRPHRGSYSALLTLDLPLERTAERNALRNSWIAYEQSRRDSEALEDQVKYQVRSARRQVVEARETIRIQKQALEVARRRVAATDLFLRAGRIQMRDVLEAQDALVVAANALVAAQVQYAIAGMELQRDLGSLNPDAEGNWLRAIFEGALL
ncbi:MAG: TolC family protein [Desulfuromonadaceae bacterium]|nr:TolC family protein [Desulfuromonadaceae bacterium]